MKLNETRPEIETSGDMEEQSFSIQDTGMIFDILRNKMYGNPILAICREISCNARDAHREVNKRDVPIEIQLPTYLEPHFIIKDEGPGISPDRMSNIFIKYTASTKRKDNVQTGGFGLGAKTPFSYSDTFTIETIFDGIKYNYAAHIDETKVGKIQLMSKTATDLPNGTAIKIPIKPQDFRTFIDGIEFVTRHWDVKPIIKGGTVVHQVFESNLSGPGWSISKQPVYNSYNYNNHNVREIKLIVDGIEYPLDYVQLKTFADTSAIDSTNGTTFLYYGVGALSLSANRESVHLDKDTKEKIKTRIDEIGDSIFDTLQKKVEAYPSLWDATYAVNRELASTFNNKAFLNKLTYKGDKITIGNLHVDSGMYTFSRGYAYRNQKTADRLSRSAGRYISFEEDTALYINDLAVVDPTTKMLAPCFEADKKLKTVQLIQVPADKTVDEIIKKLNLDKLGVKKLSDVAKLSTKKYTVSGVRLIIFKFSVADRCFKQVSIANMEADTNNKIIASLEKDTYNNTRKAIFSKTGTLGCDVVASIMSGHKDYSLYGVGSDIPADKIKENFEDFDTLEDFLNEKIAKNKNTDYVRIKYASQLKYSLPDRELRHAADISKLIKDPNSSYLTYLTTIKTLKEIVEKEGGLLHTYESVAGVIPEADIVAFGKKNPDLDFKKLDEANKKTYPLLSAIDYYSFDKVLDPVANYINLIDKEIKESKEVKKD